MLAHLIRGSDDKQIIKLIILIFIHELIQAGIDFNFYLRITYSVLGYLSGRRFDKFPRPQRPPKHFFSSLMLVLTF